MYICIYVYMYICIYTYIGCIDYLLFPAHGVNIKIHGSRANLRSTEARVGHGQIW